jgi:hypothetical protein
LTASDLQKIQIIPGFKSGLHDLTSRVINNEFLIGYGVSDASKLVTISTPNVLCLN